MISRLIIFAFSSISLLQQSPLWGAKFVVLQSGFRMSVDKADLVAGVWQVQREGGQITIRPEDVAEWLDEPDAEAPDVPAPIPSSVVSVERRQLHVETDPKKIIGEMALAYGLPEKFVASVARAESGFQPKALSPKGAIGVMQLMPGTAKELGVNPHDVRENIEGGAKLLRELLLQYQNEPDQVRKALAAYNAGPGAVKKYNGVPPYRETQGYVERVLRNYRDAKVAKGAGN